MVSALSVANTIIAAMHHQNAVLSKDKLQAVMLDIQTGYYKQTGHLLFPELFVREDGKYRLLSVEDYYTGKDTITECISQTGRNINVVDVYNMQNAGSRLILESIVKMRDWTDEETDSFLRKTVCSRLTA